MGYSFRPAVFDTDFSDSIESIFAADLKTETHGEQKKLLV
jgi:hypothetical protein